LLHSDSDVEAFFQIVAVQGLVQGEQELEGLGILDRFTRKGPGTGRTRNKKDVAIGIAVYRLAYDPELRGKTTQQDLGGLMYFCLIF
jgi:hypothetical protein